MQLQMSTDVKSCCVSVCTLRPACFAYCNPFFVDHLIVFIPERNYPWYHFFLTGALSHSSASLVVLQCDWMTAVGSKKRRSNLIGYCVDSKYAHRGAHTHNERYGAFCNNLLFNIWVLGKLLISQRAQVQVKSRVIDFKVQVELQVCLSH